MISLLTFVSLLFISQVTARSCVVTDSNWNLYLFSEGGDFNASSSGSWASGTPTNITTSGRPPFDATNTTCYLSQFYNAIYVMNGDSANPSDVHIYDPTAQSWTTQTTSGGPSGYVTILDHDTNVFYALSDDGLLHYLSFANITTAALPSTIPWTFVSQAGFNTTNYSPVMALANNHVHFLDVPGVAAGSADIFVIHFSWFQPTPQSYGNFPAEHGQTASIFEPANDGVQQAFAFIPDDGSATYVIDVISNTTSSMAGPPTKDANATYFASDAAIIQLTSSGDVNYITYTNSSADSSASWSSVKNLVAPAVTSSVSGSSTATGSSAQSTSSSSSASGSSNGAVATKSGSVVAGMMTALLVGTIAIFLS